MIPVRLNVKLGEARLLPVYQDSILCLQQANLLVDSHDSPNNDNDKKNQQQRASPTCNIASRIFRSVKSHDDDGSEEANVATDDNNNNSSTTTTEEYAIGFLSYPLNTTQKMNLMLNGMDGEYSIRLETKSDQPPSFKVQLSGYLLMNNVDDGQDSEDSDESFMEDEFDPYGFYGDNSEDDDDYYYGEGGGVFYEEPSDEDEDTTNSYFSLHDMMNGRSRTTKQYKSTVTFEDVTDQQEDQEKKE